jgi:hypothetical protein
MIARKVETETTVDLTGCLENMRSLVAAHSHSLTVRCSLFWYACSLFLSECSLFEHECSLFRSECSMLGYECCLFGSECSMFEFECSGLGMNVPCLRGNHTHVGAAWPQSNSIPLLCIIPTFLLCTVLVLRVTNHNETRFILNMTNIDD